MANEDLSAIDYVFSWLGNSELLLAIIKLVEDKMNAPYDTASVGVQIILLVEDSIRSYSSALPLLYRFVLEQSQEFSKEALNGHLQTLRMRGRPKIKLARNYEEAVRIFERYKDNMLGIISDMSFMRAGKKDPYAGYKFGRYVRQSGLIIPFILLLGIIAKKVARESVFKSAFGILIPLTTIIIGVIVSMIIRPVFVDRYMIPGLMCLWISILLMSKKCNYKIQTIVIILLIAGSLSSFASFAKDEFISKKEAENNIALTESFEDNAIVIISCNTHISDVVASYTDNMVYNWRGPKLTTATAKYREAYKNEGIFDDVSQISEWLNAGIPLYYVEIVNSQEDERLPDQNNEWDLVYIGKYNFENKTTVYKIVLKGGI